MFYNFSFENDVYYIYFVLSSYIITSYLYSVCNYKKYEKLVSKNENPLSGIVCKDINNRTIATSFINKRESIYFLNFEILSGAPDDSETVTSTNKLNKILQDYYLPHDINTPVYADYYEIYNPVYYYNELGILSSYKSDIIDRIKWNNMLPGFYIAFWTMISVAFFHLARNIQIYFEIY